MSSPRETVWSICNNSARKLKKFKIQRLLVLICHLQSVRSQTFAKEIT